VGSTPTTRLSGAADATLRRTGPVDLHRRRRRPVLRPRARGRGASSIGWPRQPLLAVVGPSGAGKSSFVQAGVLPALGPTLARRWSCAPARPRWPPAAAPGRGRAWRRRPRAARRPVRCAPRCGPGPGPTGQACPGTSISSRSLHPVPRWDEQPAYAAALVGIADDDDRAGAGRADGARRLPHPLPPSCPRCASAWPPRLQTLVTTPAAADLRRILVEPARRAGYEFEDDGAADRDGRRGGDQPARWRCCRSPRRSLWQLRDRHDPPADPQGLRALGGVGGALAQHAEATLAADDAATSGGWCARSSATWSPPTAPAPCCRGPSCCRSPAGPHRRRRRSRS
jgi:hypothetical protein